MQRKEIDYAGVKSLVESGHTISEALTKLDINSSRFYRNVPPLVLAELRNITASRAMSGSRWNKKR
jgi:hypothetical protein